MTAMKIVALASALLLAACSPSSPSGNPSGNEASTPATSSVSGTPSAAPVALNVVGTVDVRGTGNWISNHGHVGETCVMDGNMRGIFKHATAFDDVKRGAQVVVADDGGKTVAIGRLGYGTVNRGGSGGLICEFVFTARGVPQASRFYSVTVGHQPSQQFPLSKMVQGPQLVLGP